MPVLLRGSLACLLWTCVAAAQVPWAPPGPDAARARDPEYQRRISPEVRVVQEASPAVVRVEATRPGFVGFDMLTGRPINREQVASGSGVVIHAEGYIVTNYHVVANARRITVHFGSEQQSQAFTAQLVSGVQAEDLALLKIEGADSGFPTVRMGTSSDLLIGERVLAIGNPFHQQLSVSAGIISGLAREIAIPEQGMHFTGLIQTDASINPGNSGGPLLNINGEMIGINTVVNQQAENMGFAIPIDRVREVLADKLFAPALARAWLGFELTEDDQLLTTRVTPGGPADAAGLKTGDRILEIDNLPVATLEEFRRKRQPILPDQKVKLRVSGPTGERNLVLAAWKQVDGVVFERSGMTVRAVPASPYYEMLMVDRVHTAGPAHDLGLVRYDVIDAMRVEGTRQALYVESAEDLANLLTDLKAGTVLEMDVLRDENGDRRLTREELYKGKLVLR
jgi:S1-C subfamily serine protease